MHTMFRMKISEVLCYTAICSTVPSEIPRSLSKCRILLDQHIIEQSRHCGRARVIHHEDAKSQQAGIPQHQARAIIGSQ